MLKGSMSGRFMESGAKMFPVPHGLPAQLSVSDGWKFGEHSPNWEPLEVATGGTVLVSARLNQRPVKGILDSGSGASIIDKSIAQLLGLRNGPERFMGGG